MGKSIVMELICGACQGRLLVESPGSTVACPHCGAVLQTPPAEAPAAEPTFLAGPGDDPFAAPNPFEDTVRLDARGVTAAAAGEIAPPETFTPPAAVDGAGDIPGLSAALLAPEHSGSSADVFPVIQVSDTGSVVVSSAAASAATGDKPQAEAAVVEQALPAGPENALPQVVEGTVLAAPAFPAAIGTAAELIGLPDGAAAGEIGVFAPVEPPAVRGRIAAEMEMAQPDVAAAGERAVAAGVAPSLFWLVASYASAVTLVSVYLGYLVLTNPGTLDLPDLAPRFENKKKGVTALHYLPAEKQLPAANILHLGESRQFGSVRVTPLSVTRGTVEFAYYDPQKKETREPEGPVLKLHLRFENVSHDQEFAPLDRNLVYTKERDRKAHGLFKANNFVFNAGERARRASHVLVFDHLISPDSPWLMKDQNLDRELQPGESVDTFIATTPEEIETLKGELVWRVHFRKGYNPQSLRGVTTLIEVVFRSSEIVDDETPPAQGAEPASKDA